MKMNSLEVIKQMNKNADETMTKEQLLDNLKKIFRACTNVIDVYEPEKGDVLKKYYDSIISIKPKLEYNCFTDSELKNIITLCNKYNIEIDIHAKPDFHLRLLLKKDETYIIL